MQGNEPAADRLTVVILTMGTRGDVQPYVGLGRHLIAHGHRVVICTSRDFRDFVTSHGVEWADMGMERVEQPKGWLHARTVVEMLQHTAEFVLRGHVAWSTASYRVSRFRCAAHGTARLTFYARPRSRTGVLGCEARCRLLRVPHHGHGAGHCGEAECRGGGGCGGCAWCARSRRLQIPCWSLKVAPDAPSAAYPPFGMERARLGWVTRLKHYWSFMQIGACAAAPPPALCGA